MTTKTLPYEGATAGERALAELQRVLEKFGCQQFGTMTDTESGETVVNFRWRDRNVSLRASWHGYAAAYLKLHPLDKWNSAKIQRQKDAAVAIGKVAVCSLLRDWVKGQVTAVECGVMTFEAAFMPHMLLASGERVIDKLQARGGFLALEARE